MDDPFLGLENEDDFEARLLSFQKQGQLQQMTFPVKAQSMNISQVSTAHTISRKQTFYQDMKSPSRRVGLICSDNVGLEKFVDKIQYLIYRCADKDESVKNECLRICSDLGISFQKLIFLPNESLREEYILDQVKKQVLESLRQWRTKIEQREFVREKQQLLDQKEQNMLDIFDWVEIHTKFRQLKKQLKFALVEVINDQNNTKQIQNHLKTRQSGIITSLKYTKPDTRALVEELAQLMRKVLIPIDNEKQPNIQKWDNQIEEKFVQRRSIGKKLLFNEIKSSSWNVIGMGELVSTFDKSQQNKIEREKLMEKYNNNQVLKESELLYLVNTSVLLNKCSDKKFIQTAVNLLDQEIVGDIELQIAENILKTYTQLQKGFVKQRHRYIQQKNNDYIKKQNLIQKEKEKPAKKRESQKQTIIKVVKMLREMRYEEQRDQKKENKLQKIYIQEFKRGNPIANPMVWKFKSIMMKIIEKNKLERRNQKSLYKQTYIKQYFPSKDDDLTLEKIRRLTHPSSKVTKAPEGEQFFMRTPQNVIQTYKLKLYKKKCESDVENFKGYYSGGPIQARPYANSIEINYEDKNLPYKGKWITKEIEIFAINRIKRAIKKYIAKKKDRILQEQQHKKVAEEKERKKKGLFSTVSKLKGNKPKVEIDVEDCYKRLQQAIQEDRTKQKPQQKQSIDYSRIPIPKKMIQLKLKQRKLFLALKVGNSQWTEHSGFVFDALDVNCYDVDKLCPLYHAAKLQSLQFSAFLIQAGADVNMPCKDGFTPTFAAFESNNILIINLFMQHGADIYVQNNDGKNPLCYCSYKVLKELNLQQVSVQYTHQDMKFSVKRSQSMLEVKRSDDFAYMHFQPLESVEDEIAWRNNQEVCLKTFYPLTTKNKFNEIKLKAKLQRNASIQQ